jgi:hypothetical protein
VGSRLIGLLFAALVAASLGCGQGEKKEDTTEEPKGGPKLEMNPDYKGN